MIALNITSTCDNFLFIITALDALRMPSELLSRIAFRTILWVRHPFFNPRRLTDSDFLATIHVGEYQYFSNRSFYRKNWFIQNLFTPFTSVSSRKLPMDGKVKIIYLGALFQVKGFGHIARQWSSIKRIVPNAELHVIGSSSTYGKVPEHEMIPCDSEFAEEILMSIPLTDISEGRVVFHGNLGHEKFELMRNAHFAILNPTGASEAFPASPLNAWHVVCLL